MGGAVVDVGLVGWRKGVGANDRWRGGTNGH